MNKKQEHAGQCKEGEQKRKKARMSKISDGQSQKATGCAPPKRWRIEPDPEDVKPEPGVFIYVRPSRSMFGTF